MDVKIRGIIKEEESFHMDDPITVIVGKDVFEGKVESLNYKQ
jgi:hypothetical protein